MGSRSAALPARVLAAVAAAFVMLGAHAAEAAKPALLDPDGRYPSVAVGGVGAAHFAWTAPAADHELRYCRIDPGVGACAARTLGVSSRVQQVLMPDPVQDPGRVFVFSHGGRPSRLLESLDAGQTFGTPIEMGLLGQLKHTFVLGPAGRISGIGGEYCSSPTGPACVTFQSAPLTGGETSDTELNYAGPQPSRLLDEAIGLADATTPVVVWGTADGFAWRTWSGQGDINDAASWLPVKTVPFVTTDVHLLSGPRGLFLYGAGPDERTFLARFDKAANSFLRGVPTPLSATGATEAWQDAGGVMHFVDWSNERHLYAVSTDGGATFTKPVELVDEGHFVHGGLDRLEGASSSAGDGYLTYSPYGQPGVYALRLPTAGRTPTADPQISLSVKPRRARVGTRTNFRFTATYDAGDGRAPVTGATVRLKRRSAKTNAAGKASIRIRLAKRGRVTARACLAGYRCGAATIRVRP